MTGVYSVDTTQASSVYTSGCPPRCRRVFTLQQTSNTTIVALRGLQYSDHVVDFGTASRTDVSPRPPRQSWVTSIDTCLAQAMLWFSRLDWMVSREDESAVLRLIQTIDGFCRSNQFTVLLPTNALAYGAAFWALDDCATASNHPRGSCGSRTFSIRTKRINRFRTSSKPRR